MNATYLIVTTKVPGLNLTNGYIIGAIMALLILGYLIYSLIRPDKF